MSELEEISLITLNKVNKTFKVGNREIPALEHIDLTVKQGEIFGVIGHSGAGKSTLLRSVNLLETPSSGQVYVGDVELTALTPKQLQKERTRIGMIFQHFNLLSSVTVYENIAFPLRLAKQPKAVIQSRVEELLELVGLSAHASKYPAQLSGGQKQRVGIARALANHPHVLLCDEATSALDPQTTNSILALLKDINAKLGITILLITHEMHVIRAICDRVAVMDKGRIIESGDVLQVFLKPTHPTTKQFVGEVSEAVNPALFSYKHKGQIVLIHFIGDITYEPLIYDVLHSTDTRFAILQGTVSKIKDTPYGQLVINLLGEPQENEAVIRSLRQKGLEVEVLA